jgi:hypothetical protein
MAREEPPAEPVSRITKDRIENALAILNRAEEEEPLARERLAALSQQLDGLLGEIEMFKTVVYCHDRYREKNAAACLLDHSVLRVLAGSTISGQKLPKDQFWHAPSPAARAVLGRPSGPKAWKDRQGKYRR